MNAPERSSSICTVNPDLLSCVLSTITVAARSMTVNVHVPATSLVDVVDVAPDGQARGTAERSLPSIAPAVITQVASTAAPMVNRVVCRRIAGGPPQPNQRDLQEIVCCTPSIRDEDESDRAEVACHPGELPELRRSTLDRRRRRPAQGGVWCHPAAGMGGHLAFDWSSPGSTDGNSVGQADEG